MKKTNFAEKAKCCGCSACADICQNDAIYMKQDEEGFFYPLLDKTLCTGCGLCGAVCPVKPASEFSAENVDCAILKTKNLEKPSHSSESEQDTNLSKQEPELPEPKTAPLCFGAQAKDPVIRSASSSGGAFAVLAQYVLKQQGVVYGAAFNENMEVVHRQVRSPEELEAIKKTKYVQSGMDGIHKSIGSQLRQGKWVLFCGTPCQAQALRLFLNQSSLSQQSCRRLIIADLVCYGVPSPGIWSDYVKHLEHKHKGTMTGFSFRDKRNRDNGHTCSYVIDGREYAGPLASDLYCKLYFANYILRPSCHKCRFCTTDRSSDLTLGDFWGIEKVRPEADDKMGTSLVMLHTGQGRRIWELIKEELNWFSCEREELLQPRLVEPTPVAKGREIFMRVHDKITLPLLAKFATGAAWLRRYIC